MLPVLRVARPTDRLQKVVAFYTEGLGFEVLASFNDHEGFDGVIVGHPKAPYHLEFTHKRGHKVGDAPSQDHLIVLYLPDKEEWQGLVERMKFAGNAPVESFNPFWDVSGVTFEDPDGYRVVLESSAWSR